MIVAGVCLFNFALNQGENPDIPEDILENQEDSEDEEELPAAVEYVPVANDAARQAQGMAHRQWLVEHYCEN